MADALKGGENSRAAYGKAAALALLAASLLVMFARPAWTIEEASWYALIMAPLAMVCVGMVIPGGFWSIPQMSLLVLIVFHCGALIEVLISETSQFPGNLHMRGMPESVEAVIVSTGAIMAFAAGAVMLHKDDSTIRLDGLNETFRKCLSDVAAVVCILGCVMWLRFAFEADLGIGASYASYLKAVDGTAVASFYYLIALSLPLALISYKRSLARIAVLFFLAFAIVGFPLGLRGEVLFTGVVALCVVGMQRKMPGWRVTVAAIALLLIPIAVVSQTRQEGGAAGGVSTDPMQALYEMGGSVRVVSEVVRWSESNGVPLAMGETYVTPSVHTFRRFVLRTVDFDASTDQGYMATRIINQFGYIGSSIVAEAYLNFGRWAAPLMLAMWGALLSWLTRFTDRSVARFAVAVVGATVFQQLVRNAFESAPVLILYGFVIVLMAWVWSRVVGRSETDELETAQDAQAEHAP